MPRSPVLVMIALLVVASTGSAERAGAAPEAEPAITVSQSAPRVAAYDFVEIAFNSAEPIAHAFTDVAVDASFGLKGEPPTNVAGFCDSDDGRVFRVRFMPAKAGEYDWSATWRHGSSSRTFHGTFGATNEHRQGVLRVDKAHPWHFIWEGTGQHYFYNGTTAFLLMGWQDEKVIRDSIDRLARLKVNRIRVLLNGRASLSFWGEPIVPGMGFNASIDPWPARRPDDRSHPEFDYSRFNLPHFQRFERMLRHARDKDVIISVILDWNDSKEHPAAGSEDERRYYRYAAARLAAFSNVTWDLGDDISLFRSLQWAHEMGTFLRSCDPYHHLATDHPTDNNQQDRAAQWFGFTSFQEWSRPQHGWMLKQREIQRQTGRVIPQTNEEYGYEDHYPNWAKYGPPTASADNMRRIGWETAMAGCYQTTGETARRGTGYWPDTGGGWVNGRGDPSMTMLDGYARVLDFMTSFDWWKADPHDELVDHGAFCLAEPGKVYAVYLPRGGGVTIRVEAARYDAKWFDPRTGKWTPLPAAVAPTWTSPRAPDENDWALLLMRASETKR